MNAAIFTRSMEACSKNGSKLLDDAKLLFDLDRYSTALALAVLAQEEFAKAFLLQLVVDGALPWIPEVQKSMARHHCKHLLALVMDWLPPCDFELLEEQSKRHREDHEKRMAWYARTSERYRNGILTPDPDDPQPVDDVITFPSDVATALNIYRFEEIEKLRFGFPWRDEEWAKGEARKVAEGSLDRKKQSALYVDVTKTGEVGLHPDRITHDEASEAISRAVRLSEPLRSYSDEYAKLKQVLPSVFANLLSTDKNAVLSNDE